MSALQLLEVALVSLLGTLLMFAVFLRVRHQILIQDQEMGAALQEVEVAVRALQSLSKINSLEVNKLTLCRNRWRYRTSTRQWRRFT